MTFSFEEALNFTHEFKWIYDFPLTKFIPFGVWEHMPPEWLEALCSASTSELNEIPFGFMKDDWPSSLKEFLSRALKLSLPRSLTSNHAAVHVEACHQTGMSPKKLHEVSHMAGLVHELCQKCSCQSIIDVGCGLGYLSLVLSEQFGYNLLGMESIASRTHGASIRAASQSSTPKFSSVEFELADSAESYQAFQELIQSRSSKLEQESSRHCSSSPTRDSVPAEFERECGASNPLPVDSASASKTDICGGSDSSWAMIGLHCCGDLTPTMLKAFMSSPCIQCLVVLSCCYHRMTPKDDSTQEGGYRQFPLSEKLQNLISKGKLEGKDLLLTTYGLRLAAQETRMRWKNQKDDDHEFHMRNVAYRSLIEMAGSTAIQAVSVMSSALLFYQALSPPDVKIEKFHRKLARPSHYESFDAYVDAILARTKISSSEVSRSSLADNLKRLHADHKECFTFIEPFTCLQVILQPVLESLILQDRLSFLLEHEGIEAEIIPIFDENISPRNCAIVAWKTNAKEVNS